MFTPADSNMSCASLLSLAAATSSTVLAALSYIIHNKTGTSALPDILQMSDSHQPESKHIRMLH